MHAQKEYCIVHRIGVRHEHPAHGFGGPVQAVNTDSFSTRNGSEEF